LNDDYYKL